MNKELTLNDLKNLKKNNNKKIISLCHGAFDLMHMGHIKHLQNAKSESDILVVSLTADSYINKGPGRPVFNEKLRMESISALQCVDYVYISHCKTAIESIEALKPDFYVKGSDYINPEDDLSGNINKEISAVKKFGGNIKYTNEITFSSSNLLNQFFSTIDETVKNFLYTFKKKYSLEKIFSSINDLKNMNVLVVGDAIIDEYNFVNPLGQTGKGNIPSVRFVGKEKYAGGAIAVANHISNFVKKVDVISVVGKNKQDTQFLKSMKKKNVKLNIFNIFDETLTKSRYVDQDLNRFFEVYICDDLMDMEYSKSKKIEKLINDKIRKYDVVVVPDFGNGFINDRIIKILTNNSKFLAVNTQINSGNRGYHAIGRYFKADFISLNEPEARLSSHDRSSDIKSICRKIVSNITKSNTISITRGKQGVLSYDKKKKKYFEIPSLAPKVVDRIGAGDAFLSLSSILMANKNDIDLSTFVGSVAAAIDVQIVCNSKSVDKVDLLKFINTIYK